MKNSRCPVYNGGGGGDAHSVSCWRLQLQVVGRAVTHAEFLLTALDGRTALQPRRWVCAALGLAIAAFVQWLTWGGRAAHRPEGTFIPVRLPRVACNYVPESEVPYNRLNQTPELMVRRLFGMPTFLHFVSNSLYQIRGRAVDVQCRRKESSRSQSHLLMSLLLF